jgi:hypothetical protein
MDIMTTGRIDTSELIKRGILAGAAGGLAEIIWVSLYAILTGGSAAALARGVTTAAGATALLPTAPVTMGIAVHMALAVLLGLVLAGLWQVLAPRMNGVSGLYAVSLAALAAVWAVNFFVILPVLSPSFVALVPLSVSLVSKLLFGLAAAETLRRCAAPERVAVQAGAGKRYPSR